MGHCWGLVGHSSALINSHFFKNKVFMLYALHSDQLFVNTLYTYRGVGRGPGGNVLTGLNLFKKGGVAGVAISSFLDNCANFSAS